MGHPPRAFTARLSRELFSVKAIPFNAHIIRESGEAGVHARLNGRDARRSTMFSRG